MNKGTSCSDTIGRAPSYRNSPEKADGILPLMMPVLSLNGLRSSFFGLLVYVASYPNTFWCMLFLSSLFSCDNINWLISSCFSVCFSLEIDGFDCDCYTSTVSWLRPPNSYSGYLRLVSKLYVFSGGSSVSTGPPLSSARLGSS
jgi:hypothetical protein